MNVPVKDPVQEYDKVCPACGQPRLRKCSECDNLLLGYRKQATTCSGACRVKRHRRLAAEAATPSRPIGGYEDPGTNAHLRTGVT